jgi:hypothetical protein
LHPVFIRLVKPYANRLGAVTFGILR